MPSSLLYKYCSPGGIRLLKDMRLKLADPRELNDVHEYKFTMDAEFAYKDFVRNKHNSSYVIGFRRNLKYLGERFPITSAETAQRLLELGREDFMSLFNSFRASFMDIFHNGLLSQTLILCLSRNKNDPLMWSHYCDSYKGFVVAFDLSKPPFSNLPRGLPVQYVNGPPKIKYGLSTPPTTSVTFDTIRCKDDCWRYENEERYFFDKKTSSTYCGFDESINMYYLNISNDCIHHIYLGPKSAPAISQSIQDIVGPEKITFMEAVPHAYGLFPRSAIAQ